MSIPRAPRTPSFPSPTRVGPTPQPAISSYPPRFQAEAPDSRRPTASAAAKLLAAPGLAERLDGHARPLPRFPSAPDTSDLAAQHGVSLGLPGRATSERPAAPLPVASAGVAFHSQGPVAPLPAVQLGLGPGPALLELPLEAAFDEDFDEPLKLREALSQPVGLLRLTIPFWALIGVALVMTFVAARLTTKKSEPRVPVTDVPALSPAGSITAVLSGAASAPASGAVPVASAQQVLVEASRGDPDAMKQVEAHLAAGYTAEEALALARGRVARERQRLDELVARLRKDPPIIREPGVVGQLRGYAADPDHARSALEALAALPGMMGPDLLYDVWTGSAARNAATALAQELLYTRDVRPKSSAALAVALDLRVAETCEEKKAILPRAIADGDSRSLQLLRPFLRRYGCGANKRNDCYECLRDDTMLDQALKAVRSRPRPSY